MPLSKHASWPEQDSAVGFYRVLQPARFLKREGFVKESRTVPFSGWGQTAYRQYSDRTFMEICEGADVFHTTLLWKQSDILKALNLRKHFGLKWVVDIDDNIFAAPADNKAADNAELLRKNRETCLQMADGLTVSVPYLKELYAPFNKEIYVLPNGLDFSMFPQNKNRSHKKIRIGWRGAYGHGQDLELIRPVIESLKKEYPVEFVCFGVDCDFSDEYVKWVPFFKEKMQGKKRVETAFYYETLEKLNIDIAIVPLVDSAYNRCKSNIACLEWSALKVPVVLSPVENQKNIPGLTASTNFEWYESLVKLIENKALRNDIAERQFLYATTVFNMKKIIPGLADFFEHLPRRTDIEP